MAYKFNPTTGQLDLVDNAGRFITEGTNGVTTIRWQTSGGFYYDMTVDDTGHVVTTQVFLTSIVPLWFTYVPA